VQIFRIPNAVEVMAFVALNPSYGARYAASLRSSWLWRSLRARAASKISTGARPFHRGKTVSLLIGYSVGGGYDAYGRLVARHLGKHIPGNPSVVPQNMSGAGSLKAANYL